MATLASLANGIPSGRWWPALPAVLVLLSACADRAARYDRALVLSGLDERIGVQLHAGGSSGAPDVDADFPQSVLASGELDEHKAVALALWQNRGFQAALSDLGLARADLAQAGLLPNPVLSVLFPLGPKQLESAVKLPLEFLLLRPRKLDLAEIECERLAAALVQDGLDLVRSVRAAYARLGELRALGVATEESARLRARAVELLEAGERAGAVSALDVSLGRAEAHKARAGSEHLRAEASAAEVEIRGLLGLGDDSRAIRFDAPAPNLTPQAPDLRLDDLLDLAAASRPDLRAAELEVEAATQRAGLARWAVVKVAGVVDANENGRSGFEVGPGIELEVPVFDWGQARRARADAAVDRALRRHEALADGIRRRVRETLIALTASCEQLSAWKTQVLTAHENALRSAEAAFAAGSLSERDVISARSRLIEAEGELARLALTARLAWIELERAVGCRIESRSGVPTAFVISKE
jgi:cobalt-zinc-cadmium efflux system outer membrane protein